MGSSIFGVDSVSKSKYNGNVPQTLVDKALQVGFLAVLQPLLTSQGSLTCTWHFENYRAYFRM